MDLAAIVTLDVLSGIATLALVSIGLAIIFGTMRIINFAHGEFLMLGAFAATLSTNAGVNIWVSMLVIAPCCVGIVEIIVERLLIQFLYGRMTDTLIVTWGLSLFLVGIVTTVFGHTIPGISAPLGSMTIGAYSFSVYRLAVILLTVVLFAAVWLFLKKTRWGIVTRGTMQNPDMASALGHSPHRIYATTFFAGSAITGLAGGLLAPLTGVVPTMGAIFVAKAFITVIGGGAAIIAGTFTASVLFGAVDQIASFGWTPVIGQAAMLLAAVVLLRILPRGITGRFFERSA